MSTVVREVLADTDGNLYKALNALQDETYISTHNWEEIEVEMAIAILTMCIKVRVLQPGHLAVTIH